MIEIKNFCKEYGKKKVYENFDLSIEEGTITCILGASGSGKTTLLNAIAGLTPYFGEISEVDVSYIFQSPNLIPNLTVYENLKLVSNGDIYGMLAEVGLSDKANAYPLHLSGGEAQRVAVARAFLKKSGLLLMDEPFSSLDLKLKNKMIELFLSVWEGDRRTVLAVTHDVDEAVAVSDRILILSNGKIIYDLPCKKSGGLAKDNPLKAKLTELLLK